ncbi:protein phosphatase 2C-like domain-containing protein 1 [Mya arenaria]|uniref:protein phosphatase 2C-like domain-containing protein 1 n=1 Tax=Mya arenaria TaxID=6604 RepID=UPI0022E00D5F|nr:protein phosphatase 2C-like domain-containing protein 1 [Mya arenaria]
MTEASESPYEPSNRTLYDPTLNFQGLEIKRTDTPETMLTEYPFRPAPDISIICEKCKSFIPLTALKEHRSFHQALTLLRYGSDEPKNSDLLLKRRNFVMRKIKSAATKDKPVTPQQIQEINDAYEYLKSLLDGNFEEMRQVREDVNAGVGGVALNCSPDCVHAVGIAASANERWKSYMEDTRIFQDCFGEDKHKCFLGLYDGYHGRFAAEMAASELHKLLLSEMIKFDPRTKSVMGSNVLGEPDISHYKFERPDTKQSERAVLYDESVSIIQNIINICESKYNEMIKRLDSDPENLDKLKEEPSNEGKKKKRQKTPFEQKMENSFARAYYYLDILLSYGKDENSRIRWSGCSAATCVIQDLTEEEALETDRESVVSERAATGQLDPPKTVGKIHIANAGNVHGVLVRGNRAYSLTKDHTPANKKERNRILKDGGTLTESNKDCCVNGVLLTTRGLGNHGDLPLKKCVLVEPHTGSAPIDQYAQFLILATRGVWEVFTEKEAASILIRLLPNNQIPAPNRVSSTLNSLFDHMAPSNSSQDLPSSRRVSFSSRENTPNGGRKSTEAQQGRQRSATLESVAESLKEDGSVKSSQGSTKGQGQEKGQESDNSQGQSSKTAVEGQRSSDENDKEKAAEGQGQLSDSQRSESQRSKASTPGEGKQSESSSQIQNQSTPSSSQPNSSDKSTKPKKNYREQDMQTEVGSHQGDESDSGNEADVESYLDNVSFPGSISRISLFDGPPSREQIQRNHAQYMAQHLVQAALLAGAKDNVTVMIVLLPGSGL